METFDFQYGSTGDTMPPRLRIACVGTRGIPSCYSGIERACEGLYSVLAARGHEITVYCRSEQVSGMPRHYRGVRLISVPAVQRRSLDTLSHVTLSLLHALFRERYDVIHLHALAPGIFTRFLRAANVPTVATIQGLDWQRAKWQGAASKVLKFGEKSLMRNADQVIVVSRDLQRYFCEQYGRSTVHIPNGVEELTPEECTNTEVLREFGLTPQEYVLYVGRLVPEKRVEDLIAAYREVPGARRLVITGEGGFTDLYVEALKRFAAEDPRIMFIGAQQRVAVHALLHNAVIYVLPSELEGLPLSLLECMQHGTPAVVSDIPPHGELLGGIPGYDLFFPPKDADALRDRLVTALGHRPHYCAVASLAREHVRRHHSWPAIAERTEAVFYSAVRRYRVMFDEVAGDYGELGGMN